MIKNRKEQRKKRHFRLRRKIFGTPNCPRLSVFVSNKNFYAQIIDDQNMHTLCSFSSLNLDKNMTNNKEIAASIGEALAKKAKDKKIKNVVFDRGGFLFHGKIKSFADACKKNGLKF